MATYHKNNSCGKDFEEFIKDIYDQLLINIVLPELSFV
jgi:hypothetical protein